MSSLLDLSGLDLTGRPDDAEVRITRAGPRTSAAPVAIIGMSGRAGEAESLGEFWTMLLRGEETYRALSEERRADVDAYLAAKNAPVPRSPERYIGGTRLRTLADFDHRFFGLSPQEARLVDPNQRIFLETAWAALEDSGRLTEEIRGEKVGVYVGMSADFGEDYRAMIQAIAPDAPEVSVAGNVRSMIAARIAYLLDLRGPSMLIDTACSSGLVAAYTAFSAIRNGECAMALAGAVNCDLLPLDADGDPDAGIGIKDIQDTSSADHRTRTFDRRGDGTFAAEGCFVFVLKSLDRALRDGDNVHAVIMGGAVNQDGASNGITTPNVEAQADLIDAALADARVGAERIGFIEAHGTATRLGDPIEIGGIERAFARRTSLRQFCGIGSAKTNIGHMDNAAGLAGLAKLVLSLKHRTLPASLNFEEPNRNIVFPQSPVFVNDRTVPWSDRRDETLYAGISSFGLSGTNCHLIVRSADAAPRREAGPEPPGCLLLPLSARDAGALARLAQRYLDFLAGAEADLADLVFTASAGRLHHGVRAAFVFEGREELLAHLERFADGRAASEDVCGGEFRLVLESGEKRDPRDLTHAERDELSREAAALVSGPAPVDRDTLRRVASLYARGAEIDWRRAAPDGARRISLPTYPFEPIRCWIEPDGEARRGGLLDGADFLRTLDRDICAARISSRDRWELAEHRIHGVGVLPGTALVEMIVSAARSLGVAGPGMTLRDIVFATPLAVADGEDKDVHVIFEPRGDIDEITVVGRSGDGEWVRNARAELVRGAVPQAAEPLDLDGVRGRTERRIREPEDLDRSKGLEIGERWTGSLLNGHADRESGELLYEFRLPARYTPEIRDYVLHPALLDALINAPNNLYDTERLYLPLSYGVLTIHGPLPAHVFAHFEKRAESIDGELYSFDVTVADATGRVVLTVENYCIKSAVDLDMAGVGEFGHVQAYREVSPPSPPRRGTGAVLLCGGSGEALGALERTIEAAGYDCVHVPDGMDDAAAERLGEDRTFAFGVMLCPPTGDSGEEPAEEPVRRAFALLKLISDRRPTSGGLLVLTRNAFAVTGDEPAIEPGQAGVLGLMRVAALEYKGLRIRCVDSDGHTDPALLVAEAQNPERPPLLHYRRGRPHEPYMKKCAVPLGGGAPAGPANDGVVVVSGGTGELGTAVARHLARRGARRLVLLGSPDGGTTRESWSDLRDRLDVFEVLRPDLGDRRAVERVLRDLRERHGRIAGVLHLAARPGAGFLHTKDYDEFMRVYRPKALGGVHLHEATLSDDLEYFIAFSSVSGLLLHQGQADYTAANLVLDSLAQHRSRAGLPALSVQWPAWREIGMARRLDAVDEEEIFPPLDTGEAMTLLDALVAWEGHPPVIMPGRMKRKGRAAATSDARPTPRGAGGRDVTLFGMDEPGDIERAVAEIWAETLAMDELDAHDTFAALGGNSLLTSQMLKLYGERFPDAMDITDLFRYTTIAEQAACLKERLHVDEPRVGEAGPPSLGTTDIDGEDVDRLLDLLEQGAITVDESRDP
ncbi:SDR family NAD(P)-dependent oxidoreductase [Spirillospora albida]|uniref:SDR family NAD(P)-dependent oxidoreductase n=1 Tax=Spirillospora albida TaxID=58123 RepID=UPI0004C08446|nr:SDR family NAD(P)-dependent oxidoreductase [Spirillospora albida]